MYYTIIKQGVLLQAGLVSAVGKSLGCSSDGYKSQIWHKARFLHIKYKSGLKPKARPRPRWLSKFEMAAKMAAIEK